MDLQNLAASPWSIVVFVLASILVTRILDAGLKDKLPKWSLPYISMLVGLAGQMSAGLVAGLAWKQALLYGFAAGAGGVWTYSAGAKRLPGVKAAKRDGGFARSAVLALLAALGLALCVASAAGCGWSWQKTAKVTLTGHEAGLATADKVGLDYYRRTCREIAKKCPPGSDDKTCKPLGECWTQRRLLQSVLDRVALGLAVAWTAAATGDQEGYKAKLAELVAGMKDLGRQLGGIIPGGVL